MARGRGARGVRAPLRRRWQIRRRLGALGVGRRLARLPRLPPPAPPQPPPRAPGRARRAGRNRARRARGADCRGPAWLGALVLLLAAGYVQQQRRVVLDDVPEEPELVAAAELLEQETEPGRPRRLRPLDRPLPRRPARRRAARGHGDAPLRDRLAHRCTRAARPRVPGTTSRRCSSVVRSRRDRSSSLASLERRCRGSRGRSTGCRCTRGRPAASSRPAAACVHCNAQHRVWAAAPDWPRRREASGASSRSTAARSSRHVAGSDEDPGLLVLDRVDEAADGGRDHGAAVGHRLAGDDAVALAARRDAHHRRALVVGPRLVVRDEPDRFGNLDRAGSDDHARQARRRRRGTRGSPSRARGGRRRGRAAAPPARRPPRDLDAARDHAHLARAELARSVGEIFGGDEREPGAAQDRPEEPRRAARESTSVPQS